MEEALDMRHLIRLKDDAESEPKGDWEWQDYSSATKEAFKEAQTYLDGKAKRRLRRLQERKTKKLKNK